MKTLILCLVILQVVLKSSAQNIGIGTATPTKGKLEIVGVAGAGNTNAIFGSNVNGITLQQNWPTIGFNQYRDNTVGNGKFMADGYAAIQFMDPSGGGMYFDMLGFGNANTLTTSGTRALALLANGHVGINSDGSSATLTVNRGTGTDGTARFDGTVHNSHFNYSTSEHTYIRAGKDGSTVFVNDITNGIISLGPTSNARVSIGVNTPGNYPLYVRELLVSGDPRGVLIQDFLGSGAEWELRNDFDFIFVFNTNPRSGINAATGNYYIISDKRLKKNFQDLPDIMDKVMQLHPLQYDMINREPNAEKQMGFIAQEVEKLFPNLVSVHHSPINSPVYGNITDLHMMNYSGFGVIAIKAIQEQQQELLDLQKRMGLLEEQNRLLLKLVTEKNK